MRITLAGFKRFFEDMDKTRDKELKDANPDDDGANQDYWNALGDEFGIEWSHLAKALSADPWVSSHFLLGKPGKEIAYKLSAWEIVPGSITPTGAAIRLRQYRGNRNYLKGNKLNKGEPDENVYYLNRKQLIEFLTTGWTPAAQGAQGGAGAAAPGGAPPGGAAPPPGAPPA